MGVDDLMVDDQVVQVDMDKAKALLLVFFPQLVEVVSLRQDVIDHVWSTARPPGILRGVA